MIWKSSTYRFAISDSDVEEDGRKEVLVDVAASAPAQPSLLSSFSEPGGAALCGDGGPGGRRERAENAKATKPYSRRGVPLRAYLTVRTSG